MNIIENKGKVTTCSPTEQNTSTTPYLSVDSDASKLFTTNFSCSSIVKATLKRDILTLTIDMGAYRMIEKLAEQKKGTRQESAKLKSDVECAIQRAKEVYEEDLVKYNEELARWEINDELSRGEKPQQPLKIGKCKPDNFDPYLNTQAEIRCYIKSYFLYEYLLKDLNMNEEFTCEDFNKSLKYTDKEAIAVDKGARKVREILGRIDRILYTDTEEYVKGVKKQTYNEVYKYTFHPILFVRDPKSQTQDLHYKVCGTLKLNISLKREFQSNPDKIISIDEIISLYSDGVRKETKQNANGTACTLTTRTKPCNELTFNTKSFNFGVYQPDYSILQLDGLPQSALFEKLAPNKLKSWKNHHLNPSKIDKSSRQYHSFHTLPKEYRPYITFNGSGLVEAMDVKSCYYVLMIKMAELSKKIYKDELCRFKRLVRDGDIYEEVGKHVLLASTPPNEEEINYAHEEMLSFYGKTMREIIKHDMQRFRNMLDINIAYHNLPMVTTFFMTAFPTITQWLFDYPTHYDVERKKVVKNLQNDMCRIETMLISKVCFQLQDMGLTPFTLHDAIYLSSEELKICGRQYMSELEWWKGTSTFLDQVIQTLPNKEKEIIYSKQDSDERLDKTLLFCGTHYINDLFWEVYDKTEWNEISLAISDKLVQWENFPVNISQGE